MKTSKEKIAATLSALGATLIAGAEARASEFTINGGAGVDVGFVNGAATTGFTMPLPGINQGIFEAITSHYAGHTYHAVNLLDVREGSAGFNWPDFEVLDQYGEVPSEALLVGTNVYFNGATSISGRIGRLQSGPAGPTASDEYVAFRFMDGAQQYGGWAEVSILDDTYSNLTVNISEIAWQAGRLDTGVTPTGGLTGNIIATTTIAGAPEPGTLGMLAVGAALLGAAGLRRWKTARVQAVTSQTAAA